VAATQEKDIAPTILVPNPEHVSLMLNIVANTIDRLDNGTLSAVDVTTNPGLTLDEAIKAWFFTSLVLASAYAPHTGAIRTIARRTYAGAQGSLWDH
jgi:hypothetical protein